jgi:hypothetical protein
MASRLFGCRRIFAPIIKAGIFRVRWAGTVIGASMLVACSARDKPRFLRVEIGFVKRLVARFAILEVAESPAASRGIFF